MSKHFIFMTRASACDGRYLSLTQQRRAWEELNAIFGNAAPTPPGPDPPGPDPPGPDPPSPSVSGNVVHYYQGEYIDQLIIEAGIGDRVTYVNVHGPEQDPVSIPVICLLGEKESVCLWTYVTIVEDPIVYMHGSYGIIDSQGFYHPEDNSPRFWDPSWPKEFLISELFYCDGRQYVYYQVNMHFSDSSSPIEPVMNLDRFDYNPAAGDKPAVCFFGTTALRMSGTGGFIGTLLASLQSGV